MDEQVRATGLGRVTVYRLYPSKDVLVAAYLRRLAATTGEQIATHGDDPAGALLAIVDAIEADLRRPGFRGCPFNNASSEFDDPQHPAGSEARAYRQQLHAFFAQLSAWPTTTRLSHPSSLCWSTVPTPAPPTSAPTAPPLPA